MDGQTGEAQASNAAQTWDVKRAASLSAPERLLLRSNLLGANRAITNFGGGNTSSKIAMRDPLTGETTDVLWVKGSGGDLGSMGPGGFATLRLDRLRGLTKIYRGLEHEDELVPLYAQCAFGAAGPAPSDRHPAARPRRQGLRRPHAPGRGHRPGRGRGRGDADGGHLRRRGRLAQWLRPGFELGLRLADFAVENPGARGVVLQSHGLITWGDDDQSCYENTLDIVTQAERGMARRRRPATGRGTIGAALPETRRAIAAAVMPALRGLVAKAVQSRSFRRSSRGAGFCGRRGAVSPGGAGSCCPDHFLRTKIWPMVLPFDPALGTPESLIAEAPEALEAYRTRYAPTTRPAKDPTRRPCATPIRWFR